MRDKDSGFAEIRAAHFLFGDVVVDCEAFTVMRDQQQHSLPPRAFDVLRYLITHRDRVVEKSELFDQIWKERFVTDSALTRTVADIRRAIGDHAEAPRYIATVPKRGYRFVADLHDENPRAVPIRKSPAVTEAEATPAINLSQPSLRSTALERIRLRPVRYFLFACVLGLCPLAVVMGAYLVIQQKGATIRPTTETYALYLKGRDRVDTMNPRDIEKGAEYFQQAIDLDPNYALAYVGMADYYTMAQRRKSPGFYITMAKAAAARALALDGKLAEAHATMGRIVELYEWDSALADKEIKRALELDPNSKLVRHVWSNHLAIQGQIDQALSESRTAVENDPLNARLNLTVGWLLYSTRQYDQAETWFQKMIDSGVYVSGAYSWLAQIYAAQGLYEKAVKADLKYRAIIGAKPAAIVALNTAYDKDGWKGYLRALLEQRQATVGDNYIEPYVFAAIYAALGEKEQALEWLEKSVTERSIFVTRINRDPKFDSLRAEPRFQDLIRRVGL